MWTTGVPVVASASARRKHSVDEFRLVRHQPKQRRRWGRADRRRLGCVLVRVVHGALDELAALVERQTTNRSQEVVCAGGGHGLV